MDRFDLVAPVGRRARTRIDEDRAVTEPHLRVGNLAVRSLHLERLAESEGALEKRQSGRRIWIVQADEDVRISLWRLHVVGAEAP
jgi:hypothetical protein